MKPSTIGAGVAILIVLLIAVAFVVLSIPGSGGSSTPSVGTTTGTGSTSSSAQGGNQTYIATYVSPTPVVSTTTVLSTTTASGTTTTATTVTITSTTSSELQTQGGSSYTYTSSSQVKILAVSAEVSGVAGDQSISFSVTFENIGSGSIYVAGGDASGINATIESGASSEVSPGPKCEGAVALVPINPGSEFTSTAPGCWSGYSYHVQGPAVQAEITLSWSGANAGSIDISAQFAVA